MLLRWGRRRARETQWRRKEHDAIGHVSLSRVLDLVVYRSTVQAEPDSRDKGRAVRVEKQYLQLALVITSRELKMVTE